MLAAKKQDRFLMEKEKLSCVNQPTTCILKRGGNPCLSALLPKGVPNVVHFFQQPRDWPWSFLSWPKTEEDLSYRGADEAGTHSELVF